MEAFRTSVSPNPPHFDVSDARQVSPTPPPAPKPYTPLSLGGSGGGKTQARRNTYPSGSDAEREPDFDVELPPAPPPAGSPTPAHRSPDPNQQLKEEKRRYAALQVELKEKFEAVQAEYKNLEHQLREDYSREVAKVGARIAEEKQKEYAASQEKAEAAQQKKDEEMRQLHKMLELQHHLMQEQLESVRAKEETLEAKEKELAAKEKTFSLSPRVHRVSQQEEVLHSKSEELSSAEKRLQDQQKCLEEREKTVARLEKQQLGYNRMRKNAARASETQTEHETCDSSTETDLRAFEDHLAALEAVEMKETDLMKREEEVGHQMQHAEALWAAAKRQETMLEDWEQRLKEREDKIEEQEKRHEGLASMSHMLLQAACSAESKLAVEIDERLTRRLHQRERSTLLRESTKENTRDQVSALESWEQELEAVRTNLHENAVLVKNKLAGGALADCEYTPSLEEDLMAREKAMREKETRWTLFLNREVQQHCSLEAQRFEVTERSRELEKLEEQLDQRQRRLNDDIVKINAREVAAKKMEDEAANVLSRLDTIHALRTTVERQQHSLEADHKVLDTRAAQIQKEYERMRERWQLLREREKRVEQRLVLDSTRKRENAVAGSRSPSPSPFLHRFTTPAHCNGAPVGPPVSKPSTEKITCLEDAIFSITNMLDDYAARATSVTTRHI